MSCTSRWSSEWVKGACTLGSPVGVAGCAGRCLQRNFCGSPSSGFSHSFVGCPGSCLGHLLFKVSTSQTPLSKSWNASPLAAPTSGLAPGVGRGLGTLFPGNDLALGISCGHFQRISPLLPLEAPSPTAKGPRKARAPRAEGRAWPPTRAPWEATALPALPLLRSRRPEPGCWIQSLRRVLHFHKRAAALRGRDRCRRGRPRRPAPGPGVRRARRSERGRGGRWGQGPAARPAPGGSAGLRRREQARPAERDRLRGRRERVERWGEARGRDDRTPLVAPSRRQRFAGRGGGRPPHPTAPHLSLCEPRAGSARSAR